MVLSGFRCRFECIGVFYGVEGCFTRSQSGGGHGAVNLGRDFTARVLGVLLCFFSMFGCFGAVWSFFSVVLRVLVLCVFGRCVLFFDNFLGIFRCLCVYFTFIRSQRRGIWGCGIS